MDAITSFVTAVLATSPKTILIVGGIAAVAVVAVWRALKKMLHKILAVAMVPASGGLAGITHTISEYWNTAHNAGMGVFDYITHIF